MSKPADKFDVVLDIIEWLALASLLACAVLYLIDGCFRLASVEFVTIWWCLLSIIRRREAVRLRASLRKSLDGWGECVEALRGAIALKDRLILRVVSLKGAVARASKARKADKAKLRRVREIASDNLWCEDSGVVETDTCAKLHNSYMSDILNAARGEGGAE